MYNGDRARKDSLIKYGFRLPSAYDNRPLMFNEFEERIAATRRTYNARVTKYNNLTQKFPTVMLATLLGFSSKELLQAPEEKKDNVDLGAILRG